MNNKRILLDSSAAGASVTNNFSVYLSNPIYLGGIKWNCALTKITTYYSWYNISAQLNNNIFQYYNGTTTRTLTIPDGTYSFPDLMTEIQDLMITYGDYTAGTPNVFAINASLDDSTGYITLTLTDSFTVTFINQGMANIWGANMTTYSTSTIMQNKAQIRAGIDTIFVHVNLVSGNSYINGGTSDVIYNFAADVPENGIIDIEPGILEFIGVSLDTQIQMIHIYLTDQKGNILNLNGAPLTVSLLLQPIK